MIAHNGIHEDDLQQTTYICNKYLSGIHLASESIIEGLSLNIDLFEDQTQTFYNTLSDHPEYQSLPEGMLILEVKVVESHLQFQFFLEY